MGPVRSRPHQSTVFRLFLLLIVALTILAACGNEGEGDDLAAEAEPTPNEEVAATPEPEPTETPEPVPTATPVDETDDASADDSVEPEPTATPEPTPEPAEDIDFAPELTGLTDWRNSDPATLEDLRGEPVVLVFWNSI